MMLGSKAPDSDAYGLFRAMRSLNPTLYSFKLTVTSQSPGTLPSVI